MLLIAECLGHTRDRSLHVQDLFQSAWQHSQLADHMSLKAGVKPVAPGEHQRQHHQCSQLGSERFGRGNTDLRAGMGHK